MLRIGFTGFALALIACGLASSAQAQTPPQPPYAVTKVDGTDNVYIFRYGGHQSMFIVTKAASSRPTRSACGGRPAKAYIDEIRKVTEAPIKYVIYSHTTTITSPAASRSRTSARRSSRTRMRRRASSS